VRLRGTNGRGLRPGALRVDAVTKVATSRLRSGAGGTDAHQTLRRVVLLARMITPPQDGRDLAASAGGPHQ
jgi:hypothetical protein